MRNLRIPSIACQVMSLIVKLSWTNCNAISAHGVCDRLCITAHDEVACGEGVLAVGPETHPNGSPGKEGLSRIGGSFKGSVNSERCFVFHQ